MKSSVFRRVNSSAFFITSFQLNFFFLFRLIFFLSFLCIRFSPSSYLVFRFFVFRFLHQFASFLIRPSISHPTFLTLLLCALSTSMLILVFSRFSQFHFLNFLRDFHLMSYPFSFPALFSLFIIDEKH